MNQQNKEIIFWGGGNLEAPYKYNIMFSTMLHLNTYNIR